MANKRMFSLKIVDTDAFLDMPLSTQALYFHLSMRADDDGFVSNPKKVMRSINCSNDDMKVLLTKRFILPFDESGIIVIKHWRIHNTIQKDRYTETTYLEEKAQLLLNENKSYSKMDTVCIQNGNTDKISIDKNRLDKKRYREKVMLTQDEYDKLIDKYGKQKTEEYIDRLNDYIQSKGKRYKSHYHTILTWIRNEKEVKQETAKILNEKPEVTIATDEEQEELRKALNSFN